MNSTSEVHRLQQADASEAESIMLQLLDSLCRLDRAGAPVAAAYVQTSIDHFRLQFDLDEDISVLV